MPANTTGMSISILQYLRDSKHFRHAVAAVALSREEPFSLPGDTAGVPVNDIAAGETGSFRLDGVYRAKKANPATAFSVGEFIEFNGTTGFVAGGSVFEVIEASGSGAETVVVQLLYPEPGEGGEATTRKIGVDDLGDASGSVVVDFTTGDSDNKKINVNGNITDWTLTFGQPGDYDLYVTIETQGFAIPKPSDVRGDWLLVDETGVTNHIPMTWDGSLARISGVITTDQ